MSAKKKVEIVIPIYNEEKELSDNIKKLHKFLKLHLDRYLWHITIADNASTDDSLQIAGQLSNSLPQVDVIHLDKKGRGRAVKHAWMKSNADYLVYMDVDLSTDLSNLTPLLDTFARGYDIAIGSRLLPESRVKKRPIKREILSRGYNILIRMFFGVSFSDAQCGFKAVTAKVVKNLLSKIEDNAWFFDSELLIVGEKSGYKICEIPVFWVDNPGSTVRVLKTVYGDLSGLWRLFWQRPWTRIKKP